MRRRRRLPFRKHTWLSTSVSHAMLGLSPHQLSSTEEEELVTSEEEELVTSEEEIMPRRLSRRNADPAKQTLDIALGALINGFTTAFSNTFLTFTRQLNDLSLVLTSSLPAEPVPRQRSRRRPRRVRSAPPTVLNAGGRRRRRNAPKSDAKQTAAFKARVNAKKRQRFTPNLNRARSSNTTPPLTPPPPPPAPPPAPLQKSAPSSSFVLPTDPVESPEEMHSPLSMPVLM